MLNVVHYDNNHYAIAENVQVTRNRQQHIKAYVRNTIGVIGDGSCSFSTFLRLLPGTMHHHLRDFYDEFGKLPEDISIQNSQVLLKEVYVCRLLCSYMARYCSESDGNVYYEDIPVETLKELFKSSHVPALSFRDPSKMHLHWLNEADQSLFVKRCEDYDRHGLYALVREQLKFELLATETEIPSGFDDFFVIMNQKKRVQTKASNSISDFFKLITKCGRLIMS